MNRIIVQTCDPDGKVLDEGRVSSSSETLDAIVRGIVPAFMGAGFHRDSIEEALLDLAEEIQAARPKEA